MTPHRGLWAVVVLGGLLRIVPIWFGLPYLFARPDEETAIGHAAAVLGGDLNPHFFHWPSFIFYAFAAVFAAAERVRSALSIDPSLTVEQQLLLGRACVAGTGTLTIVVVFHIGRRIAGPVAGLLAALFLAVAILHVRESHFAMTDVVMTCFLAASLAMLLRAVDVGDLQSFAIAGALGGLAASTKYSAAAIAAGTGAAQIVRLVRVRQDRALSWRDWLPSVAFAAAFAAAFVAATPYAVLDRAGFESGLRYNFSHLADGHVVDLGRGWIYHLSRSLPHGAGVGTFIAAAIGAIPFARHYRGAAAVIGAFAGALYFSIGSGHTVFFRYALPLVPVLCVSAAIGVRHAAPWLAPRVGISARATLWLLAAVVALPAVVNSVWFDVILARTDTRVLAAAWLRDNAQPGHTVLESPDPYTQLDVHGAGLHAWAYEGFLAAGQPAPDWLVLHESPLWTYARIPAPLRRLADDRYVLAHTERATRGAARSAVYDLQDAFFMPVSGFSTVVRPGPTILIYRRTK